MNAAAWRVEFHPAAVRELRKLGPGGERRVLRYLRERIANSNDPRRFGHALIGERKGLWRYRVGDYRIVASIEDDRFVVLVVAVGHRRGIYRCGCRARPTPTICCIRAAFCPQPNAF